MNAIEAEAGETPLDYAVAQEHAAVAELLLKAGAKSADELARGPPSPLSIQPLKASGASEPEGAAKMDSSPRLAAIDRQPGSEASRPSVDTFAATPIKTEFGLNVLDSI